LGPLLAEHRQFVARLAAAQDGRIVKGAGDGFWIAFSSATGAGLAAIAMQEELWRSQSNKGDDRLAMRTAITLGDVLYEDGDFFGDAVSLAARIEAITPADEIYMSDAAKFAISQTQVRTALVDVFDLKGFTEPVPVYRIEQRHRAQVITDQYIMFTDLSGFSKFFRTARLTAVERALDYLLELVGSSCRKFGGVNRFNTGDAYCLTFSDPFQAMAAAHELAERWEQFNRREHLSCSIRIALHKGAFYLYRSYLLGNDVNIVAQAVDSAQQISSSDAVILVTGQVQKDLADTPWADRLQSVDIGSGDRGRLAGIDVFRLQKLSPASET